ncbi:sensor domain-containing diguanylate cyclase [Candidatus Deferrimicrobium sp.]|uniref:sensor domain-containing diguanylate cyclase n=1 Tax=Candidatus Deferrimicrobium sp. TaxID=3060586 RepID=UPI002ED00882
MPGEDDRGGGIFPGRSGWRARFALAWCGLLVLTAAVSLLLGGFSTASGILLAGAVAGEFVLAVASSILLERTLFGHVGRLRNAVTQGTDGPLPSVGGPMAPLAEAISARQERSVATLREAVRDREGRLAQVERLRRDLEETRTNLESNVQYLRTMAEVSTVIAGTLDPEELYRILPERVMAKLGLNDFCIMLYSQETQRLVAKSVSAVNGETTPEFTVAPGEGVAGKVFATGEPAWIPDVGSSPDFLHYKGIRTDVRSFMCVPLVSKGKNIGVLMLNHPEPNAFEPDLLPMMRVLASYLAIAIENAEMFRLVKSLAEKDSLTLLYNHGAFHEKLAIELERANRYIRPVAVIMLDLDHFKEINDRYGHTTGDRVLSLVAGVLGAHLRKTDIAARYGGDEFAVILPETDLSSAAVIAERIAEGISSVRLDIGRGSVISFTASIGYASCGHDAPGRGEILDTADRLMFESKRRGPGGVLGIQI